MNNTDNTDIMQHNRDYEAMYPQNNFGTSGRFECMELGDNEIKEDSQYEIEEEINKEDSNAEKILSNSERKEIIYPNEFSFTNQLDKPLNLSEGYNDNFEATNNSKKQSGIIMKMMKMIVKIIVKINQKIIMKIIIIKVKIMIII